MRPFVYEVSKELTDSLKGTGAGGGDRDFSTKVTQSQGRNREGSLCGKLAEELGWITKLCVALIVGPHMLRCLYPRHP